MKSFFGSIVVGIIKNEQVADLIAMDQKNIRFVQYPDCQQLIVWLTHPGREYSLLRLINTTTGKVIEECPVADRLSGSIQILWDTLPIPPGNYVIEVERTNGGSHTIEFEKLDENITPVTQPPVSKKDDIKMHSEKPDEPIQYRDGVGKLIENEDLVLRERLIKELAQKFSRKISYEGNLRAGTIIYSDSEHRIEFYHEMGGGNCMLYIDVPTKEQWELHTKTALSVRDEILEFVASSVQAEQAPSCRYEIKSNSIIFYYQ